MRFHDIGQRLIDLGEILRDIGTLTENDDLRATFENLDTVWADEEASLEANRKPNSALRRTLANLGSFRKDYSNWERVIVEYVLKQPTFTQRDVARLLGVGLSTVNRWAQHPLTYDED